MKEEDPILILYTGNGYGMTQWTFSVKSRFPTVTQIQYANSKRRFWHQNPGLRWKIQKNNCRLPWSDQKLYPKSGAVFSVYSYIGKSGGCRLFWNNVADIDNTYSKIGVKIVLREADWDNMEWNRKKISKILSITDYYGTEDVTEAGKGPKS